MERVGLARAPAALLLVTFWVPKVPEGLAARKSFERQCDQGEGAGRRRRPGVDAFDPSSPTRRKEEETLQRGDRCSTSREHQLPRAGW